MSESPIKGLKISNSSSMFSKKEPEGPSFDERVNNALNKDAQAKLECMKRGTAFLRILEDTTLVENKSPKTKDEEKKLVEDLVALASIVNNDELEDEGLGSMVLITLLVKAILTQRDKINNLSYELSKIKDLKKIVESDAR
jgi:hypothetical protein